MKFIENETPFITIKGEPLEVPKGEENDLVSVLRLCLISHQPTQDRELSVSDYRSVNKVMDVLEDEEGKSAEDGWYGFEDTDFKVLQKIVGWIAPLVLQRNSPKIMDILEGATGEKIPKVEPLKAVN